MKQNFTFIGIFLFAMLAFFAMAWFFVRSEPQIIEKQEVLPILLAKDSSETENTINDSIIVLVDSVSAIEQLKQTLLELDTAEALVHGAWGFCLSNTKTGEIIAQRNQKQSLVPASVMKMINTGVALQKAGKDYHFKTFLQIDGELDSINRILKGNIYIKGGGDPTLGSRAYSGLAKEKIMNWWLEAIKKLKIDSVQGAIIADARFYEYEMIPAGWTWEDLQTDYGVGASGLSFCENTMELTINNGNIVETSPNLPYLQLINQLSVDESVSEGFAFAAGSPYENKRYVRGIVKKGKTIQKIPLPDPPLACAYTLLETLKKNKIFVRDSATTLRHLKENMKREDYQKNYEKPNRRTIHSHYSPDLKNLILHTNTVSQNFYAESIFKLIGIVDGNYGATVSGGLAVEKFWKDKVNLNGFYMTDGSGLSRLNAVTCQQLTEMLNFFAKQANFSDYYETLAVAGRSGTMSKMCLKTLAENNVRAKSGTMSRVKSYAGYVTDKKGNLLSFAMISNNHTSMPYEIRRQFEKIMVIMANLD